MKLGQKCFFFMVGVIFFATSLQAQIDDATPFYWADTVTVVGQREVTLPRINAITTKMPLNIQSTPASVGVVTRAVFENQNGQVLSDALYNVSGINVQSQFGVHDYFIIRGFDSISSGMVLTDGTPEPEATFYHLYNIQSVEVLKGPGTFLYGGNPMSGMINLNRKKPIFSNFLNFSGSYGKFQTYNGSVDFGIANQNSTLAFRLNALAVGTANYRDAKDNDVLAVNPALTWRINEKSNLNLNFEYVDNMHSPDAGIPLAFDLTGAAPPTISEVARTTTYQPSSDFSDQKVIRFKAKFDTRLNKDLTLQNRFYYSDLDWDSESTLLNGAFQFPQVGDVVRRSNSALDDRQKIIGNQLELLANFETGSVGHTLLTGFEVSRLSDDFGIVFTGASSASLVDPSVEFPDPEQGATQFLTRGDGRSLVFAPYFVDRLTFSEKLQLFLGGRFDRVDYEDDRSDFVESFDLQTGYQASLVPSSTNRSYSKFSPMVGLMLSATATTSVYGNFGQAFAAPSTSVPGDLEAEQSTQFEAGIKNSFNDGRINLNVAVFHLERENIPIPNSAGQIAETGTQKSKGFELELSSDFGKGLFGFASYAFTDAELSEFSELLFVPNPQDPTGGKVPFFSDYSGQTPAFAPEHILNFWITKEFENGLGISGGGRYVSSQFIAPDNQFEIGSAFTLDAAVSYRFNRLRWSVNFRNITDTDFETRGFRSTSVIPANPFAVYGGVDVSL